MSDSRLVLSQSIDKEDLNGLLQVMQVLQKIDERDKNLHKMFDSIKETIKLLKEYDIEFDETGKVADQQVMLPGDWKKLIEMALNVTQTIAPVKAYQIELSRKRIDLFNLRTKNYRERFKQMPVLLTKKQPKFLVKEIFSRNNYLFFLLGFDGFQFFFAPCKNVYKIIDRTKKDLLEFEESLKKLIESVAIFKITPPNQTQLVACSDELVLIKVIYCTIL